MPAAALLTLSHRFFAVETIDEAWSFAEMAELAQSQPERRLAPSWASLYHWSEAGGEIHWARARGTVSQAARLAGDVTAALAFAQAHEDAPGCEEAEPWDRPWALAAKSRALARLRRTDEPAVARESGVRAWDCAEDPAERKIMERDLGTGPWYGVV